VFAGGRGGPLPLSQLPLPSNTPLTQKKKNTAGLQLQLLKLGVAGDSEGVGLLYQCQVSGYFIDAICYLARRTHHEMEYLT